ncbi:MAG: hypothetical protein LBS97_02895 [Treponema sp.]|jgi:hypothetical protein|nr:hypothetical protein [Treponema sp.]
MQNNFENQMDSISVPGDGKTQQPVNGQNAGMIGDVQSNAWMLKNGEAYSKIIAKVSGERAVNQVLCKETGEKPLEKK